jgi:hypothetical protein
MAGRIFISTDCNENPIHNKTNVTGLFNNCISNPLADVPHYRKAVRVRMMWSTC